MAKGLSNYYAKRADKINRRISQQMSKMSQQQLNRLYDKAYFNPKNAL